MSTLYSAVVPPSASAKELQHLLNRESSEDEGPPPDTANVGGEKNITFFGGVSLLLNNITGPGLVTIPLLFQEAGLVTPLLAMVLCMVFSSLASQMMCEAMARIPGNHNFEGRIEFASLARELLPKWLFWISVVLFVISLMTQLVSSIIISAQVMDAALIALFKHTYAIEFYPHLGYAVAEVNENTLSPFGSDVVFSLGFVVILIITIPMSWMNLDDNMIVQIVALVGMLLIFVEWTVACVLNGIVLSRVPLFGATQSNVLGTVIFNYAFVLTVPSWVNEKKEGVSISKTVWSATFSATFLYAVMGLLGAWALDFTTDSDMLSAISSSTHGVLHILSAIAVYMYPAMAMLSSIPVYSIVIRYNLVNVKFGLLPQHVSGLPPRLAGVLLALLSPPRVAFFWAVIFPWVISIIFYGGAGLLLVINWTALFVLGFINFSIPFILYIAALRRSGAAASKRRASVVATPRHSLNYHEDPPPTQPAAHHHRTTQPSYLALPGFWKSSVRMALAVVLAVFVTALSIFVIVVNLMQSS